MPKEFEKIRENVLEELVKKHPNKKMDELESDSWAIAKTVWVKMGNKPFW